MTLNISVPTTTQELRPKITVIGVGGAGGNAVNNMIAANLEGIEFLVTNTDGQALAQSLAERKIQLGCQQTQGLGAGSKPDVGRIAAEESLDDILAELTDCHMVFITAGMGGGTGTGAAPVIAKAARERGILTVGVVTKPFDFEGQIRMRQANAGIEELQAYVDTLIIIPNQNLFRLANERTTFADAFAMADEVLHKGVCGITDLMIKPGDINLDFADIRSVMSEMGKAMMGTGEASGENRAAHAAEAAINNPLLDETSMSGAQAVLINITGGTDMTLFEVDEAANHIRREVDTEANIIIGSAIDDRMDGVMRVSVVATGMEASSMNQHPPKPMIQTDATPVSQPNVQAAPIASVGMTVDESVSETASQQHDDMADLDIPEIGISGSNEPSFDHVPMAEAQPDTNHDEMLNPDETATDVEHDDEHDDDHDDQTHLEDLVAASEEVESDQENNTVAQDDVSNEEPSAAMDKPFTMRTIVDIPEETPQDEAPKSLIGHIAGLMFASKSEKAEASPKEPESPVISAPEVATASHSDNIELIGSAQEGSGPELSAETSETEPEVDAQAGGLASLKPVDQPKLNIAREGEDVDLDIPAFLRRQAN